MLPRQRRLHSRRQRPKKWCNESSTFQCLFKICSNCCPNMYNQLYSRSHKRHILLKFYYLGWDYQGFTDQEHTSNTIGNGIRALLFEISLLYRLSFVEHHLFKSLIKVCLIEARETSNYHRCGRTDKGVSAFSQVSIAATSFSHSNY